MVGARLVLLLLNAFSVGRYNVHERTSTDHEPRAACRELQPPIHPTFISLALTLFSYPLHHKEKQQQRYDCRSEELVECCRRHATHALALALEQCSASTRSNQHLSHTRRSPLPPPSPRNHDDTNSALHTSIPPITSSSESRPSNQSESNSSSSKRTR